jgi:hypothetical protein
MLKKLFPLSNHERFTHQFHIHIHSHTNIHTYICSSDQPPLPPPKKNPGSVTDVRCIILQRSVNAFAVRLKKKRNARLVNFWKFVATLIIKKSIKGEE